MAIDLSAYEIVLLDALEMVRKLNDMRVAIQAGVNDTEDSTYERLDDQDAIIAALAPVITSGVTFKGLHSAAGAAYPSTPVNGDYWIISVAGTISSIYYQPGDAIIYHSASWITIPATPELSRTNPLAYAVSVAMSSSTTVGGIQGVSATDLNMGTNDFTITFDEIIPTTRPSADIVLDRKHDGTSGWILTLRTTGIVRLQINSTTYDSTVAIASATNVNPRISVPVVRSSASAAGSVTICSNGVIVGAAVAITAGAPVSVDNTSARIINGTATTRNEGRWSASRLYNRALSAAQVADLAINGPALTDRVASNTNLITGDSVNFEGGTAGLWVVNSGAGATSVAVNTVSPITGTYDLKIVTNGASNSGGYINLGAVTVGKKYRLKFAYKNASAGFSIRGKTATLPGSGSTWGTFSAIPLGDGTYIAEIDIALTTSSARFHIYCDTVQSIQLDTFEFTLLGITSELLASNAQGNTGQVIDTSGNRNHHVLPASGATVVGANPARSRQVRSRHTWTATSELQYWSGVNQEILPSNAALEYIDISSDASLSVNIGNGTTATFYASAVALVSGWNRITVAGIYAGTTSATRKITITPTASATASLQCVATYHATEIET